MVRVPDAGVPSIGPVIVGEVSVLLVSVCVAVNVTSVSVIAGRVNVTVPNAPVVGASVIVPLVALRNPMLPTALPAVPSSNEVAAFATSVVKTPVLGVVPPIAPGEGKEVTLADPLKLLPPIVRVVVSCATVPEALPVPPLAVGRIPVTPLVNETVSDSQAVVVSPTNSIHAPTGSEIEALAARALMVAPVAG